MKSLASITDHAAKWGDYAMKFASCLSGSCHDMSRCNEGPVFTVRFAISANSEIRCPTGKGTNWELGVQSGDIPIE